MNRSIIAVVGIVGLAGLCLPAWAGGSGGLGSPVNGEYGLPLKVTVLAGFPTGGEPAAATQLLVPGVVLLPGAVPAPSPTAEDLAERLRAAFGLASVEASPSASLFLRPGQEETVNTSAGKIDVRIKLIQYTVPAAAFEVTILDDAVKIGEAKLIVERGNQGIMGGRNGQAAPYFFVVLEPQMALPPPAAGIHRVDEADLFPPKLVHKVDPQYPEEARKAGVSGTVIVAALIAEDGSVENVQVLRPLEKGCTEAAVAAVKQWRYEPARSRTTGKPVRVLFTVTIKFHLD
jgi:TonB family protein